MYMNMKASMNTNIFMYNDMYVNTDMGMKFKKLFVELELLNKS